MDQIRVNRVRGLPGDPAVGSRAANEPSAQFSKARRRPLLEPFPS